MRASKKLRTGGNQTSNDPTCEPDAVLYNLMTNEQRPTGTQRKRRDWKREQWLHRATERVLIQ